jgi:hypothetical protein
LMLKKTITYTNPFTDQEVSEEHYFHISKADLVEMEMEEHSDKYVKDGEELTGMRAKLQRIVDSEDGKAIMTEFKDMIRRSYGRKEGERFLKSSEIADDFMASEAFSQLLWELCTNPQSAAEFVNGIVPANLDQVANEVTARSQGATPTATRVEPRKEVIPGTGAAPDPTDDPSPRVLTQAEVVAMDSDELKSGLATGRYKLS